MKLPTRDHDEPIGPAGYRNAADKAEIEAAQTNFDLSRQSFNNAFLNYLSLGGTVDYRSQLPR